MAEIDPHTPNPGFETTDINVWAVGKVGIALVSIVLVSLVLLFGLASASVTQDKADSTITILVPPAGQSERILCAALSHLVR